MSYRIVQLQVGEMGAKNYDSLLILVKGMFTWDASPEEVDEVLRVIHDSILAYGIQAVLPLLEGHTISKKDGRFTMKGGGQA